MKKSRLHDGSMVGRSHTRPETDEAFHEIGMAFSPESERATLQRLAAQELPFIIDQLERWAKMYPRVAADGYRHLLAKYQDHTDRALWEKRVDELELAIVGRTK